MAHTKLPDAVGRFFPGRGMQLRRAEVALERPTFSDVQQRLRGCVGHTWHCRDGTGVCRAMRDWIGNSTHMRDFFAEIPVPKVFAEGLHHGLHVSIGCTSAFAEPWIRVLKPSRAALT